MPLNMNSEVFITCAVTGSGSTQDRSQHVPRSPEQIANSAIEAANAGAAVVHCHVRDPETGVPSRKVEYYREVTVEVEKTSEVVQCFSTTGTGSHTLLVTTKNSNTLEELLRKIQSWPGVTRTETQIILSSYKNGIVLPI